MSNQEIRSIMLRKFYNNSQEKPRHVRMRLTIFIFLCMLALPLLVNVNASMDTFFTSIDVLFENKAGIVEEAGSGIFGLEPDKSILIVLLTNDDMISVNPSWSPDGRKIVYESVEYSNYTINTINIGEPSPYLEDALFFDIGVGRDIEMDFSTVYIGISGQNLYDHKQVAAQESGFGQPVWCLDSNKIVFSSNRSGNLDIWIMDSDGTNEKQLTSNLEIEDYPSCSPDGTKIAFAKKEDNWNIWVMDIDGTNEKQLTTDSGNDKNPSWSPDGSSIAFLSNHSAGIVSVWVMDAAGTDQIKLPDTENSSSVAWSPDGAKLTFTSNFDDFAGSELWLIDKDGTNRVKLSNRVYGSHSWSPDGAKIVTSYGNFNIGVIEVPTSIYRPHRATPLSPSQERVPGFAGVCTITGFLAVAYLTRRKKG